MYNAMNQAYKLENNIKQNKLMTDKQNRPDKQNNYKCEGRLFIEGVTVCVDYADFLDESLTENLTHFDEFVVVTSYSDKWTQAVCEKHSVQCVQTDVFNERENDVFNKGAALNLGMSYLRHLDWILCMDADIVLPDRFRSLLNKVTLDTNCIYGADRLNVVGYEQWQDVKNNFNYKRQFQYKYLIQNTALPLGARLVHNELGYCPIGYFQLWHSSMHRKYPLNAGSAENDDVLFASQWTRIKRILLPTVLVHHLESEKNAMGVNWNGRKTKPFQKDVI